MVLSVKADVSKTKMETYVCWILDIDFSNFLVNFSYD